MIEKITQEQINDNSVGKLSTRPNAPAAMGGNGLSAAALRARFDALALLGIGKINEILSYLHGELPDGTPVSFASLIKFTGNDGVEYNLEDILESLQNGGFFPVDQSFDPESTKPQSGTAVTEAIESVSCLRLTEPIAFYTTFEALTAKDENGVYTYRNSYTVSDFNRRPVVGEMFVEDCTSSDGISFSMIARIVGFAFDNAGVEYAAFKVIDIPMADQTFKSNSTNPQSGKAVEQAMRRATVEADALCRLTVSTHNISTDAHNDIRVALQELADRINAALNSDDTTLDQLSEIVAYIKSNKELIDAITTSKISVDAIVDNLTTNDSKKVLSAKQGMVLKQEIPLVLPYTIEWKKEEALIAGATGDVQQRYFNRTPQAGDQFSFYCYRAITVGGSIAEKSYHVSAHITVVHTELKEGEDFLVADFVVDKAVLCTHPVDAIYLPDSPNAQSGVAVAQAVAQAIAAVPKEVLNITQIDTTYDTAQALPIPPEGNGACYLVKGEKAIYAYDGTTQTWTKKHTLKAHTLYCVLNGDKAGLYRYSMADPYLVTVESHTLQEAKDYTDQKFADVEVEVDQTYSPESENPQSGIAVAEAVLEAVDIADSHAAAIADTVVVSHIVQEEGDSENDVMSQKAVTGIVGDISSALDELHAYAQNLASGGTA